MRTITISRKLFLGTTLVAFSLESAWLIHVNRQAIDPEGIPIMLALFCPLLLAAGCAVGFVIAAVHGILMASLFRAENAVASRPAWDSQMVPLLLGGCSATALSLVLENQTRVLHKLLAVGGHYLPFVLWWLMFALSAIAFRRTQTLLLKRRRRPRTDKDVEP